MPTLRQRRGAAAEERAIEFLVGLGWRVLQRNVRLGRDEIDIVALDPGPPPVLVAVEVRSATSSAFGAPEERIDRAKVGHLYRALRALPTESRLPRRVDLVVVDQRPGAGGLRHQRGLEPP